MSPVVILPGVLRRRRAAVTSSKIGFTSAMSYALDYGAIGRVSGAIFHNAGDSTINLLSALATCSTAPSGGSDEIKVTKLASGYTDPDSDAGTDVVFTGKHMSLKIMFWNW